MLKIHQDIIISNLSVLVAETDLQTLVPELLNKNVFNKQMINRILNPSHNAKRQKTDLYVEILKRGPQAFEKLQQALVSSNHSNLAEILKVMDSQNSSQIHRSVSLNSLNSNASRNSSYDESESDGPCFSMRRKNSAPIVPSRRPDTLPSNSGHSSGHFQGRSNEELPKNSDFIDFQRQNNHDPKRKVFNLPAYRIEYIDGNLRDIGILTPDDTVTYTSERNLPVNVKSSTQWQFQAPDKPLLYKMDSNPRGYALLVNNVEFDDKEEYPDRLGSENDFSRLTQLLEQLHFVVESHQNKTRREMEKIVETFSKKHELNEVDCVWVIFMSHGQEGDSYEDSEILGSDGIGLKTEEIISRFYSDCCPALINKPKLFFFQACRGNLTDPGVLVGRLHINFKDRITTDGKRVVRPLWNVKVRTQSDIFIAYPAPGGMMVNRDRLTGAWFIQAVVDIFSEHAWNTHLEDLLKLVDRRIKNMNNLLPSNFQAVTTKSIGWNKHLFFNPGLYRDRMTGATSRFETSSYPDVEGGMDVVDASSSNSDPQKSPNGTTYSRLKDNKDEEDSDNQSGSFNCLNFLSCRTS